jgi:hypothetical protein
MGTEKSEWEAEKPPIWTFPRLYQKLINLIYILNVLKFE